MPIYLIELSTMKQYHKSKQRYNFLLNILNKKNERIFHILICYYFVVMTSQTKYILYIDFSDKAKFSLFG